MNCGSVAGEIGFTDTSTSTENGLLISCGITPEAKYSIVVIPA